MIIKLTYGSHHNLKDIVALPCFSLACVASSGANILSKLGVTQLMFVDAGVKIVTSCFLNSCCLPFVRFLANSSFFSRTGHVTPSISQNVTHQHLSRQICGRRIAQTSYNQVVWGVMQHRVYQTKVKGLDDLKRRLINVWDGIHVQQSLINDAINQWRKRLCACVRARGGHYEH